VKVLFDHPNPFLLAHGGFQIQIEQTKRALEEIGVQVEWLRWWDETQTGEVIHYFGRPATSYIEFAHQKGFKVVMSELLTGLGSRTSNQRKAQKLLMNASRRLLPNAFTAKLSWDAYRLVDAAIALTPWEKHLMVQMFKACPERVHVVPNGVEEIFFSTANSDLPSPRSTYLVCTATITERKRVVELAEAAIIAQVPVWIIGTPYTQSDPYYIRFLNVVARSKGLVKYEGGIPDRAQLAKIYNTARGFVLLSTMESLSLSALEAAASGCPLLLSDLPWARSTFGSSSTYSKINSLPETAQTLKDFYNQNSDFAPKVEVFSWREIAKLICSIYCL
jgi:glycosyltransferase involved in cell wall biosynthesis